MIEKDLLYSPTFDISLVLKSVIKMPVKWSSVLTLTLYYICTMFPFVIIDSAIIIIIKKDVIVPFMDHKQSQTYKAAIYAKQTSTLLSH